MDLDQHFTRSGYGRRHLLDAHDARRAEFPDDDGFHGLSLARL
jgi:hypothetical protein